jgi:hypothetical protein
LAFWTAGSISVASRIVWPAKGFGTSFNHQVVISGDH